MTVSVALPDEFRDQIVEHCLTALPNEGCGLLAMNGDRVVKVYPTGNDDESSNSYTIPPQEHYDALMDAEANGWRLGGVFHSHPNGPAQMSETDMAKVSDPEWVYMIVSLVESEPVVTAWRRGLPLAVESDVIQRG